MRNLGSVLTTLAAVIALTGVHPRPAAAWLYEPQVANDQVVRDLAFDPAGSIIAASIEQTGGGGSYRITKLSSVFGGEYWHHVLNEGVAVEPVVHIAVDDQGDIAVCGAIDSGFKVVKLSATDGSVIWETPATNDGTSDRVGAVAFDADGDVLALGFRPSGITFHLVVIKLDGSNGSELWRYETADCLPTDLAVDAAGDVIAVCALPPRVVKLSGTAGAELWRHDYGLGEFNSVVVDSTGDVFAGGYVADYPSGITLFALAKFSGPTGAELWHWDSPGVLIKSLALTASGDIVAGGASAGEFAVYKAATATGNLLWQRDFTIESIDDSVNAVAIDSLSGDVYATGRLVGVNGLHFDYVFNTYKFSGADGATLWHRSLEGTRGLSDEGFALAARPNGGVITAGTLDNTTTGTKKDAVVYGLTTSGHSITARNTFNFKIGQILGKKWLWGISAEMTAAIPEPGDPGDPIREGAQLELSNPGTRESAIFPLPPGNWHRLGRVGHPTGFKYFDSDRLMGPCSEVLIAHGKLVANCKSLGRVVPISLDEMTQGSFNVALRFGGGDVYCWSTAGGEVLKDFGIAAPKRRGLFKARNAPEPRTCE